MDIPHAENSFDRMPKVELHRHLEGSIRLGTLIDIIRKHPAAGLPSIENIPPLVRVNPADPQTFTNFLGKFLTLRNFYLSPEIIQQVAYEAVADAAAEGVRYLELRFTPSTLGRVKQFPLGEVMDWVLDSCERAGREHSILTRLILSLNRHDSVELAAKVIRMGIERIPLGIVGIDLAGNEADFPVEPFIGLLREARQSGLQMTIHAGEWGGAQNVRYAIEELGTQRIGHGVRVMEDPAVVDLARESGVFFEVCPSSNVASGVVANFQDHPLPKMLAAGLRLTLNTDDPAICSTTLPNEYRIAYQMDGVPFKQIVKMIWNALEASFLPETTRQKLMMEMQPEIKAIGSHF